MIHLQVTTGTEGIVTLDCPEHKIKVEFCYKADDDQYYIEVHQPYRPVQTQIVVRSDYERDEVFDYRAGKVGRKSALLKARPVGVKAAKLLVQRFYEQNSDWLPDEV